MSAVDQASGAGGDAVAGEVKPVAAARANGAVKMVKLGDVLTPTRNSVHVDDPKSAKLISVKLHGQGAVQRIVGDGKAPKPFIGNRGKAGQFVFSRIWARRGAMALIPEELDGVVVTNEFPLFDIDKSQLAPDYFRWFINTPLFLSKLESVSAGASGQNRVRESAFLGLEMAMPSLEEQRRIAEILDRADEIRAKRRQQLAHLDDLTQAIFHDMFLMKNAEFVRLGCLAEWKSGGTPSRKQPEYFRGDIPWVTSGELGALYVDDTLQKITEDALSNSAAKLVRQGSILVGMYDTAALKTSIATRDLSCNQAVAFGKVDQTKASSEFLYFAVNAVKQEVLARRRGVRQKNLNLSMVRDIQVPIGSIQQQKVFVGTILAIQEERKNLERALVAHDELFASLQSCAFTGQLRNLWVHARSLKDCLACQ